MSQAKSKLTVLVSSTVYGIEELLDRVYTLLTLYDYEVWMSHKGTVPVRSDRTAFENCLTAVESCDLFLGIITPHYGSGQDPGNPDGLSITHISVLRNPDIAHALYLRGLMEKASRGSVLMVEQCRQSGLPDPVWRSDPKLGVTVTFRAPEVTPEVTPEVKKLIERLEGELLRLLM